MKNIFLLLCAVMAVTLYGSGSSPHSGGGGGGGPDTGAIARDNTRPPTANIDWANFDLTGVGSLGLNDGTDSVTMTPFQGAYGLDGVLFGFTGSNDFSLTPAFGSSVLLQNNVPGSSTFFDFASKDDDGTDSVGFSVARRSGAQNIGAIPLEFGNFAWRAGIGRYSLDETGLFGGTFYPFQLTARADTTTPNILMQTNGNTEFPGGSIIAANTTTTTTKTGPHLFVGTTAGAPTGVPADSPAGRTALNVDTTNDEVCFYDGGWVCLGAGGGESNTSSNAGGGEGLAKAKVGVDLPFKSLVGGTGITLSSDANEITIDSDLALTASGPANVTKSAAVVGVATDAARADHKHDIATAAASSIGTANTEGSSTSLARADHGHNHGSQTVGTHHAVAIAGSTNGFMSGADKTKLDGIAAGATVGDDDAIHDNVAGEISAITEKVTPVSGDFILIEDSAAANVKKRVQVGNLPAPTPIFGGEFSYSESLGVSTTTSVTYIEKLKHTTASIPAGTYYISWSAGAGNSNSNKSAMIRIQLDDSTIFAEGDVAVNSAGQYIPVGGHAIAVLGAGVHFVDIDYLLVSIGTAQIRNARLSMWRVG